MIKEILKGNNNPLKTENKSKKKTASMKGKSKRINSVLNDFITFRKIDPKKKAEPYLFEKTNSVKIIINKKKQINNYKQLDNINKNENLAESNNSIKRNIRNGLKIKDKEIKSYTVKRRKDISSSKISNLNSVNFDESRNFLEKSINRTEKISDKYLNDNIYNKLCSVEENENGCNKKKRIFAKKSDNNNYNDNLLFINNLEQEFEIRILKKKIKKLKDINTSLKLKIDNLMEKNYLLESDTLKEQKKRANIILSSLNIVKSMNSKDELNEEYDFKKLISNLMDLKYNYENTYLNNNFLSSVQTLFKLSHIFIDNKNRNNNDSNNAYYNIKNIIRLKNKYINDIKQYNILKIENKKCYNYLFSLGRSLNLKNLDELEMLLKKIKSSNDNQIRKIIKMKNVLFDENIINKRKININSSVDNIKNQKRYNINFNYTDLQKYFIDNNKNRQYFRNNKSAKLSNMDIKRAGNKNNNLSSCLTEKTKHNFNVNNGNRIFENKTCIIINNNNNQINYYNNKRLKIFNKKNNNIENNIRKNERIKTNNNIYLNKENNDNENNYLYYSYKNKAMNIPYNSRTYKQLEDKRQNNKMYISTNHIYSYNDKTYEPKINNRINNYSIIQLNNKLNKSIDIRFLGLPDNSNNEALYQRRNYSKDENNQLYGNDKKQNYNNININFKKKTFNIKNIKNYEPIQLKK